ncbi:hypothetical protein GIB67_015517 [Kingdonia uniflora]|uniref:G domain-containing protein n=1 Tax=Kingdonia uniflora TaxID=39325 RepID=A0A7J7LAL0_9MAGN|nr:hypothetical protein GIB67_015517 [Kingdonia uniflora]
MRALRALRGLTSLSSLTPKSNLTSISLYRFYSAQPQEDNSEEIENEGVSVFDSNHYRIPVTVDSTTESQQHQPTWDNKYRQKVNKTVFRIKPISQTAQEEDEEEERQRATLLAKVLLQAALRKPDDEEEEDMLVKEEDQKSLSVGIIGAPNAGKSALTNFMVGSKVAAVSRKTNTTTHEVLGVMTKENTQICFFDTPGLMLKNSGYPYKTDVNVRVESAWSSVELYDVLMVIFDVNRHLNRKCVRIGEDRIRGVEVLNFPGLVEKALRECFKSFALWLPDIKQRINLYFPVFVVYEISYERFGQVFKVVD